MIACLQPTRKGFLVGRPGEAVLRPVAADAEIENLVRANGGCVDHARPPDRVVVNGAGRDRTGLEPGIEAGSGNLVEGAGEAVMTVAEIVVDLERSLLAVEFARRQLAHPVVG